MKKAEVKKLVGFNDEEFKVAKKLFKLCAKAWEPLRTKYTDVPVKVKLTNQTNLTFSQWVLLAQIVLNKEYLEK